VRKQLKQNSYFILSIALSISAYRLFPITYTQSKIMTRCPNSYLRNSNLFKFLTLLFSKIILLILACHYSHLSNIFQSYTVCYYSVTIWL